MASERATPIIVGVGEIVNRSKKVEDAIEPVQLMLQAVLLSIKDTGLSPAAAIMLQENIDSVDTIRSWTWPYPDLPGLLSEKLGIEARHKFYSPHAGNQPAKLVDESARRISLRETKVAVVTGGEALASLTACAAAKKMPPPGWSKLSQSIDTVFAPSNLELEEGLNATHDIGTPIQVYPLFENSFRASRGQSIQQNHKESAQMYAEFADVAEHHPFAWNYGRPAETEKSIGTVSPKNRMICFPYTLLMNAFNTVNMAAACLLTSTEYATELGIPKSRWIYTVGGAGTSDSAEFWQRPNFYTSPSINRSLDYGLEASGLKKNDIDLFDFYSCFPIVPKFACDHLGLQITKPPKPFTLLGGLTSFGGAGNNYSMHAITESVRNLRKRRSRPSHALILANGGHLTYQHVIILSTQPRTAPDNLPYPDKSPLPETIIDIAVPPIDEWVDDGEATVETYTVDFARDGTPTRGHIVGRMKSTGHRFVANHGDAATLKQLASWVKEPIGRVGWAWNDRSKEGKRRNLFTFREGRERL